jgi:hypothetical protein
MDTSIKTPPGMYSSTMNKLSALGTDIASYNSTICTRQLAIIIGGCTPTFG